MGRRASIILPKRFRRGFRGATGGGGAAAFTTLGPNAPPGLISPFPDFIGDTLPAKYTGSSGTPNIYGMGMPWEDARCWELVADLESPSGLALRMNFYGSGHPRCGVAWMPTAAGGGSPVRGTIRSGLFDLTVPRKWRKLYIHHWHKFSANFSVDATLQINNAHDSGTATAGSTITTVNDASKAWVPNEHVGRFVRHGAGINAGHGAVIISNTPTSLTVAPEDRFNYAFSGESYQIFSWTPTATTSWSAGCKGWFWPLQQARMVGPVAGRGDGAILGAWNAPKDFISRWPENHYHGCWQNHIGGAPGAPGAPWDAFALQLAKRWDPPWPEDANDLPVWDTAGRFSQYPHYDATTPLPYTRGTLRKMEYYLEMNTPGVPNGIWRAWDGGVLVRDHTDVMYTDQYISALAEEQSYSVARPIIGGASRDAAYEIIENYWGSLFSATTFGGIPAGYVPTNTQSCDILAMAVSGAP